MDKPEDGEWRHFGIIFNNYLGSHLQKRITENWHECVLQLDLQYVLVWRCKLLHSLCQCQGAQIEYPTALSSIPACKQLDVCTSNIILDFEGPWDLLQQDESVWCLMSSYKRFDRILLKILLQLQTLLVWNQSSKVKNITYSPCILLAAVEFRTRLILIWSWIEKKTTWSIHHRVHVTYSDVHCLEWVWQKEQAKACKES